MAEDQNRTYTEAQKANAVSYEPLNDSPQIGFVEPKNDGSGTHEDPEAPKNFSFDDQSIRKGFIRKVYLILMGQLLATLAIMAPIVLHEPTQMAIARNPAILFVAMAVTLITILAMSCCESVRRTSPTNLIFLGIFTVAEAFLVGFIASAYAPIQVLTAVGITAGICLALTIYAMQTKYDFTVMGGVLVAALFGLIIMGIVNIFVQSHFMETVQSYFGALLFSAYMVYDTQMMMGGNHKYSISPEEYIFAALNLYLDIINLLIYILRIIGDKK